MSALRSLRIVAFSEGLSLLVLVFVAMPLKHVFGMPTLVRIAGAVHGLLFLMFLIALFRVVLEHRWQARRLAVALLWSLVPFGAWALDRALQREQNGKPYR